MFALLDAAFKTLKAVLPYLGRLPAWMEREKGKRVIRDLATVSMWSAGLRPLLLEAVFDSGEGVRNRIEDFIRSNGDNYRISAKRLKDRNKKEIPYVVDVSKAKALEDLLSRKIGVEYVYFHVFGKKFDRLTTLESIKGPSPYDFYIYVSEFNRDFDIVFDKIKEKFKHTSDEHLNQSSKLKSKKDLEIE